jgi:hypothetical protein
VVQGSQDIDPNQMLPQRLFLTLAQQMKMPLMNIARRAELGPDNVSLETIRITADAALRLLDNYLLGIELTGSNGMAFETEPVSVASVLYDAGNQIRPLATAYGVTLDLRVDGKYNPVMAHRRALQAALVSLGYALIETLPALDIPQSRLHLTAHRCRYGIVAGMYCDTEQITPQALRTGRGLYGYAHQPLADFSYTSGAGVFVADAILHAMKAKLSVSRHQHMHGLGVVLPMNPQLRLV